MPAMFGGPAAPSENNWFEEDDSTDAANSLIARYQELRDRQRGKFEADILHMSLYAGRRLSGYGIGSYWQTVQINEPAVGKGLAANIIKNACNAVTSKVGKNRPKPAPVVDEGDFSIEMRAQGLSRFVDGMFYETGMYELDLKWLLQSTVLGTGIVRPFRKDDPTDPESDPEIGIECCLPGSVVVDESEAIDGKPMTIIERRYMDKTVLALMCPDFKEQIMSAELPKEEGIGANTNSNQCLVIEAWRLPGAKIKRNPDGTVKTPKEAWGRHIWALASAPGQGEPLLDEPYFFDRHPHVALRYDDELLGYWGCGIAYQGFGYQSEINRRLIKEQMATHLCAVPHCFVDRAWNMDMDGYTNEIGTFIEGNFNGQRPEVITPQLFGPEFYNHMATLRAWFFEDLGISQMMAQGQKPAGITAAVALEAITDSDTERHVKLSRRWEQAHVDVGNWFIDLAKQINEGDAELGYVKKKFAATFSGGDTLEALDWDEVDMPRDEFVLKVQASSALPDSLSARKQFLTDLRNQGDITSEDYMRYLNIGDFKSLQSRKAAPLMYLGKVSESLKKGTYIGPEPDDDLQLAVTYMLTELQKLKTKRKVPEEVLQLFRDYLLEVKDMLNPPAPPPPPAVGAGAPAPGGAMPPVGPGAPMPAMNAPAPLGMQ